MTPAEIVDLAEELEKSLDDEHGKYEDHYLKNEDCKLFDRIEWLKDVAASYAHYRVLRA